MKLLIKEKVLSIFDGFKVFDENGKKAYFVDGKFSLTSKHCFAIEDKNGKRVAMIKEELISLLPRFDMYEDKKKLGHLQKKITLLKPKYELDFKDWKIKGDYFEWDYTITDKNDKVIATIDKKLLHFVDTYVIDIRNPRDALYVLMVVVAIDAEKCTREKKEERREK